MLVSLSKLEKYRRDKACLVSTLNWQNDYF